MVGHEHADNADNTIVSSDEKSNGNTTTADRSTKINLGGEPEALGERPR